MAFIAWVNTQTTHDRNSVMGYLSLMTKYHKHIHRKMEPFFRHDEYDFSRFNLCLRSIDAMQFSKIDWPFKGSF